MSSAKNGENINPTIKINMWIILLILTIVLLYIILIIGPSVVAFFTVFARKTTTPLNERKSLGYYEPFVEKINSSTSYLSGLKKSPVRIKSFDGAQLYADFYDSGYDKTAICVHGYASGPDYNFAVQGEFLNRQGFNLLFINQRAHDKSGGKNITFGLYESRDLICWIDKAKELGAKSVLLYGISMGGATVAYASKMLNKSVVRAMIIDCAFSSPYEQLKHDYVLRHMPWRQMLAINCFLAKTKLKIDLKQTVAASLKQTQIPAFFIHGNDDSTVLIEQGRKNYEACSSEKQFYAVENGSHTVSFIAGGEKLQKELKDFLNKQI